MNNLDIRWGRFERRPRRKTHGCAIHNKGIATPVCAQSDPSPKGCSVFGHLRRCKTCEWNNHSLRFVPCVHPEYAATFVQVIH
jgi:hypothetical protein